MNRLIELFEEKQKDYLNNNSTEVFLSFSQKLNNKVEKLKAASFLRREILYENLKIRTSIGTLIIEEIEENKKLTDFFTDRYQSEMDRIVYKKIFIEKKDKEFRKEELRKIRGKGFNSQKIEILLELLSKEQIDKLFHFHDLFENILKIFINKKIQLLEKSNEYTTGNQVLHLISIEENRVLRN